MANHVNSYIEFHKINNEAKAKLVEMVGRCREQEYGRKWFGDIFVEGDLKYEDVEQYSWTTEHIGPKWCYIEDYELDVETPYIVTESAWSAPVEGVARLVVDYLNKYDDKIVWSIKYEDEMPNFIGAYVYENDECLDGTEDDEDEIRYMMFAWLPHLKEQWNEDEDYWKTDEDGDITEEAEKAEDEYREMLFEWISERQEELINDGLQCLEDCEEEE
jgi:hypothetical protein